MIVGATGGGKTRIYEILQDAMNLLRKKESEDERFQKVKTEILNPKAISMGELYGEVNNISQEWHDGLASKIMRKAALEEGTERTWIIFDGPVDALWIENMNTVLDDTMTLCLSNGQRIKLRPQMRMLFEVADLAVASPATVSRCGMVYVTAEDLGWRPYVKTWIPKTFSNKFLNKELKEHLWNCFDIYVEKGLMKLRASMSEAVKSVDLQCVISLCNFLEVFLTPENIVGEIPEKKKLMVNIFCFSYIWGVGAGTDDKSKERVRICFIFKITHLKPFLSSVILNEYTQMQHS